MIELCNTKCCGVMEINNLSHAVNPEDALVRLKKSLKEGYVDSRYYPAVAYHPARFVTFTGVTRRVVGDHASRRYDNYGQTFADYLEAHNLGKVISSEERINWTENPIKLWIWHPNYDTLWNHIQELEDGIRNRTSPDGERDPNASV